MNFINSLHPVLWAKIITLIVIIFYAIFTFVVFSQIRVMSGILRLPYAEKVLKTISVVHIILAISLFLLAVVIL